MSLLHQHRQFGRAISKRQSDDFARQRSRYVDIFSRTELRLSKLCLTLGLSNASNSVGQKIGELKSLKASPTMSKTKVKELQYLCNTLSQQTQIRNAIVHSTMTIGNKASQDVAFFQKVNDEANGNPIYFVMSFDDFAKAIETITNISDLLDGFLNPPSSPPQPKPGAAGGL